MAIGERYGARARGFSTSHFALAYVLTIALTSVDILAQAFAAESPASEPSSQQSEIEALKAKVK